MGIYLNNFFFALIILMPLSLVAQKNFFWQTPEIVHENKMEARATSISYPSLELALEGNTDLSPRKMTLNGLWRFEWAANPSAATPNFFEKDYDHSLWKFIEVPSNWELSGFGKPWQRLTPEIFASKGISPLSVPKDYNPTGCYIKKINLPNSWKNMQYTLHVGAASSALIVWVNGNYVGYSEDNRLPAEFDITPFLNLKENIIALQVIQWSDGSYLEDQDHWRMSGITREVYIEGAPLVQIYDFEVRTNLDDDYKDAQLQVRPEIKKYSDLNTDNWTVEVQLFDHEEHSVFNKPYTLNVNDILNEYHPPIGNRPFENLVDIPIVNPKKWSAEYPNLYTLVLTLKDDQNKTVEARSTKVGFREIDLSDGQFKVNGVPVLLHGVNRHDWDPINGKAASKESMRRDVQLMKQMNVNASRSSHYPNQPYWYELCNEYGIYVMNEANIESHGVGSLLSNLPQWHNAFLERGIRMVERDKNHPSIVSWSLGNEAGFGPNHAALSSWIKEFDPTRPIHSEGAQNIYGYRWPKPEPKDKPFTDIISRMYRLTDDMIALATQAGDTRPVIWSEYAHSQGNSTGDLDSYWKAIRTYPRLVGGFVWDWRDQLIYKKTDSLRTLWKHGTDFNQTAEDLKPIQKGLISADGEIKSGGQQAKYIWQPMEISPINLSKGIFQIENRHYRKNINEYDLIWFITEDGMKIHKGKPINITVAPGGTEQFNINIPKLEFQPNKTYHITFQLQLKTKQLWASKGFVVAQNQFEYARSSWFTDSEKEENKDFKIERIETDATLTLNANNAEVVFDKVTGYLTSFGTKDKVFLKGYLKPNFWRAPTDNDLASGIYKRQIYWKHIVDSLELIEFESLKLQDKYEIKTTFKSTDKKLLVKLFYNFEPNGVLHVSSRYFMDSNLPDLPRIGLNTQISSDLNKLEWFGRGPLESYEDKKTGAMFGRYKTSVKKDFTYYVRPQESGNKTDVYWFNLQNKDQMGFQVLANLGPINFSVWPYNQKQIEESERIEDLEYDTEFTLNIDYKQMGVGGDNTWSHEAAPHEDYRLPPKNYDFEFMFKIKQ